MSQSDNSSGEDDNSGWSEELKKECLDSARATVEEGMFNELLEYSPNMKKEEIVSCICSVSEDILPNIQSYDEMDKEIEKDSTLGIQMMKSMMKCSKDFGEAFETLMWEQFYQTISYNAGELFAECIVSQAKEKYDVFELIEKFSKGTIVDEFMYDCEGLLPEIE
jgi:hypothetical protein